MYSDATESVPKDYVPNECGIKWANGDVLEYRLSPHTLDEIFFAIRRKQTVIGAIYVCFPQLMLLRSTNKLRTAHSYHPLWS